MSEEEQNEAISTTDEENDDNPVTVLKEERYVNEDGKTVIRRVVKKKSKKKVVTRRVVKKKPRRKSDPPKPVFYKESALKDKEFQGIPTDVDEDWRAVKLNKTARFEPSNTKGDDSEDNVPEWQRKTLKKANPNLDALISPRQEENINKPAFGIHFLKKTNKPNPETNEKKKEEEVPEWQKVKLKSSGATLNALLSPRQEAQAFEKPQPDFRSAIKKSKRESNMTDEEREKKARESEQKAIERRKAREEQLKLQKMNEKELQARKNALIADIDQLTKQKSKLNDELSQLKEKIRKKKRKAKKAK